MQKTFMAFEISFAYTVYSILLKKCHVGQYIQPMLHGHDSMTLFCFGLLVTDTGYINCSLGAQEYLTRKEFVSLLQTSVQSLAT